MIYRRLRTASNIFSFCVWSSSRLGRLQKLTYLAVVTLIRLQGLILLWSSQIRAIPWEIRHIREFDIGLCIFYSTAANKYFSGDTTSKYVYSYFLPDRPGRRLTFYLKAAPTGLISLQRHITKVMFKHTTSPTEAQPWMLKSSLQLHPPS